MMCYTLYLRRFLVLVGYLLVCSIMPLMSSFVDACLNDNPNDYHTPDLITLLDLEKKYDPLFDASFNISDDNKFIKGLNGLWDNFGNVVPLKRSDGDVCGCSKITESCKSDLYKGYLCYEKTRKNNVIENYKCSGICALNSGTCDPDSSTLITPIGNEPMYFEINMLKYSWNRISDYFEQAKNKLIDFPQSKDGYMWSWGDKENWPTGNTRHYDTNAKYILATYRYLMWTDDFNILNACVYNPPNDNNPDKKTCASRTVLQKIIWAMNYQLEHLNGKSGFLETPTTPTTEEYQPVDYWDNHIAGYHSANLNVYFYASLRAMAVIKKKLKDRGGLPDRSSSDEAANSFLDTDYDKLAEDVKKKFNGVFWDSEKGRYISSVDRRGTEVDFGMTFLQFEAMYYDGLVDKDKASAIYDWLDGDREIKSDLYEESFTNQDTGLTTTFKKGITGKNTNDLKNIYSNIYKYKFAPVSNTKPFESIKIYINSAVNGYWWHNLNGGIQVGPVSYNSVQKIFVDTNASYGKHLENGGAIFYTSFYDIMARFKYLGANDAHKRMTAITNEYDDDKLVRDPGSLLPGAVGSDKIVDTWKFGIIGEYPESGLVPTVFLYGYMGIDAKKDGLNIRPNFPSDMTYGKVNEIIYHGNTLGIEVSVDPDNEGGKVKTVNIEVKAAGSNNVIDLVVGTRYLLDPSKVVETSYPNNIFSIKVTDKSDNVIDKVRRIGTDDQGILKVSEPLSTGTTIIIAGPEPEQQPCSNINCPQRQHATYDGRNQKLIIPFIDIFKVDETGKPMAGEIFTYEVSLDFNNVNGQPRFLYNNGYPVQPPNSTCRNATYSYPDGTVTLPCVDYYESGIIPICRYSDPIPVYSATLSQQVDPNNISFTLIGAPLKDVVPTYTYCTN